MKRDIKTSDIIYERISPCSISELLKLPAADLIIKIEKLRMDLHQAVLHLVFSTWGDVGNKDEMIKGNNYTIKFLKNEGYIKDTED